MAKVTFIITTFNNKDIIDECLDSVKNQNYADFNITVVDDCSTDGTPEHIKKKYPNIKVIQKQIQTGPSSSRNIGITNTKSDYVVFMDSDVVLNKMWVGQLVRFMGNNKEVGIVAGKLMFYDDKTKINSAGGGLFRMGVGFDIGRDYEQRDVLYVCSAAMMARKKVLDEVGGFDDSYFYGYEDTDLGWRVNLAGYRVVYYPQALAYHKGSQTVSSMPDRVYFHAVKNRIRTMLKNYETKNWIIYIPINILFTLGNVIRGHRVAQIKGILWNFTHIGSTLRERKIVQQARKIKDKELFRLFHKLDFRLLLGG